MNRSQRCGTCRGCQAKACGSCVYCQDSPQFGGPGVKKQSCIERRCLRVLENRLQRDAPSFKAKSGCGSCDDCQVPDCQICLVCLDRRFFDNRYLPQANCAKKRCSQARSLDFQPVAVSQRHDASSSPAATNGVYAPPHLLGRQHVNSAFSGSPHVGRPVDGVFAPVFQGTSYPQPPSLSSSGMKRGPPSPGLIIASQGTNKSARLDPPLQLVSGTLPDNSQQMLFSQPSLYHPQITMTTTSSPGCSSGGKTFLLQPMGNKLFADPSATVMVTPQMLTTSSYAMTNTTPVLLNGTAVSTQNGSAMAAYCHGAPMDMLNNPVNRHKPSLYNPQQQQGYEMNNNGNAQTQSGLFISAAPSMTTAGNSPWMFGATSPNLVAASDTDPFVPPSQLSKNVVLQSL